MAHSPLGQFFVSRRKPQVQFLVTCVNGSKGVRTGDLASWHSRLVRGIRNSGHNLSLNFWLSTDVTLSHQISKSSVYPNIMPLVQAGFVSLLALLKFLSCVNTWIFSMIDKRNIGTVNAWIQRSVRLLSSISSVNWRWNVVLVKSAHGDKWRPTIIVKVHGMQRKACCAMALSP